MNEIQFGNNGSTLCCPHCDSDYLHHGPVDVQTRRVEDGKTISTVVTADGSQIVTEGGPIASSRRHSVVIGFWCEGCEGTSALVVCQHKGTTIVGWASAGEME